MTEAAGHVVGTLTSCENGRVAGAEGLIGKCSGTQVVVGDRVFVSVPNDRLCECGFPSCRATGGSSATARRNNVHSVGFPKCGARQLVYVLVFFFCRESGVQASRIRVGCMDGWIWAVRLVWSRLVSWRGVLSRIVSSGAES
jgi:hypothetical protein